MKTLDRYVASLFLRNLAIGMVAVSLLFILQGFLYDVLDHDFPLEQVIVYHALSIPEVMVRMSPAAAIFATVLTFASLNRTNELTAIHSIGIGRGRLVGVLLSLTFLLCCVQLVFQDRILPPFHERRTEYYWRVMKRRPDFYLDFTQNKVWYRSKNLIYNLRSFDRQKNRIEGMTVYTFDENFSLAQVMTSKSAEWTGRGWRLLDGNVTIFDANLEFPVTRQFSQKLLVIPERPNDFVEIESEVDGLRLKDLWHYIARAKASGMDTKVYEAKFHSKISLSFTPLVMTVLGVPFSLRRRREGGMARDLGLCLAITFFYWLLNSIGLSLGSNGALPPWLAAWLPSTIFAAVAATLIARRRE